MTSDTDLGPAVPPDPSDRAVELVLARMHLRSGLLTLARSELEGLSDIDAIDPMGLADLAEVRWRTGELVGAGRAADAALEAGIDDPVALVVAAEAAVDLGRPSEARRVAARAVDTAPATIDRIFAGMPRSAIWPPDAHEPLPTAPTLFDRAPGVGIIVTEPLPDGEGQASAALDDRSEHPMTLGLWAGNESEDPALPTLPDPADAFDIGRIALMEGAFDEAAFQLGLALRLAPALAPAVLEVTDGARARGLTLVRGDAYRLAGHESEARQAYALAARGGLPERRSRVRVKSNISGATAVSTAGPVGGAVDHSPAGVTEADEAAADATERIELGSVMDMETGPMVEDEPDTAVDAEPGPTAEDELAEDP